MYMPAAACCKDYYIEELYRVNIEVQTILCGSWKYPYAIKILARESNLKGLNF